MDINPLTRNKDKINASLVTHGDGTVSSKTETMITIPSFWEEKGLFIRGDTLMVAAICPIIIDKYYGILNTLSMIATDPESVTTVTIDDDDYILLNYTAGDRILSRPDVVIDDGLPYKVFDAFIDKGKIPWYLSYEDIGKLMDSSHTFAGLNFNVDHAIFEMVASLITRSANDRSKFYRHSASKSTTAKYTFIPMRSVQYGASNTTAKLIGAYWSDGLTSALVHPSERKELIEDLLRS